MDTPIGRIILTISAIATMAYPGIHKLESPSEVKPLETNIAIEYNLGKFNEQTFTPTNTPTQTPTATPTEVPYQPPAYQASVGGTNTQSSYYWGQCVWYVAGRRPDLPNLGNAINWLWNARARGIATGGTPIQGAVVSLNESYWGHVAYVEKVEGSRFQVSEMNVNGVGVLSYRWINTGDPGILGFIY